MHGLHLDVGPVPTVNLEMVPKPKFHWNSFSNQQEQVRGHGHHLDVRVAEDVVAVNVFWLEL